jgi:hypothetical protein
MLVVVRFTRWTSEDRVIGKGEYLQPDGFRIIFWFGTPGNVYADPCGHAPLSPPPSPTAAGLK